MLPAKRTRAIWSGRTHNLSSAHFRTATLLILDRVNLIILTWTGCTVLKKTVQHPAAAGLAHRLAALGSWPFGVMKVIIFQARCRRSRRLGT